jgi:hypothetical protein
MLYHKPLNMKKGVLLISVFFYFSCIPLRIAPNIKSDKVMVAKKFKRKLPKRYAFIFEDPKEANEFYNYVNIKHELNHQDVEWNVPFEVDGELCYFSFYEVEIPDKTLNILPIFIDAALQSNDLEPMFEEAYTSRTGNWYLAITVVDDQGNDCLKENYVKREAILNYLKAMRVEYLNTHNYLEALLKR